MFVYLFVGRREEEVYFGEPVARPSIAVDMSGAPHIVFDSLKRVRLYLSSLRSNGTQDFWSTNVLLEGSRSGPIRASRLYVSQIEISERDVAWISCKSGTKEYGDMLGQIIVRIRNISNSSKISWWKYISVHKGMGLVSVDNKVPSRGVVLGSTGSYVILNHRGDIIEKGNLKAGQGGEKVRFRIASYGFSDPLIGARRPGVWHTCMNGYSRENAKYMNNLRFHAGLSNVVWADYGTYPSMGNDLNHPGLGVDPSAPEMAYLGGYFGGAAYLNIWDGKKMLRPANDLIKVGAAISSPDRHGPAFAPIGIYSGVFMAIENGKYISLYTVFPDGTVKLVENFIYGRYPALAFRDGILHMAYCSLSGGLMYRCYYVRRERWI